MASDAHRIVLAVWRIESARRIAGLVRLVRDVGLAEEFAQDALVAALEVWPTAGVSDNPGAWLMTTARRRAIDRLRRDQRTARTHDALAHEPLDNDAPDVDAALDDDVGDDVLRLAFIACHAVLALEARVALTLRVLGGLKDCRLIESRKRFAAKFGCKIAPGISRDYRLIYRL